MGTYGVTYAGQKNPRNFGTYGSRSLGASQPMGASPRPGFVPIPNVSPLDTLHSALASGLDSFNRIAPPNAPKIQGTQATKAPSSTVQGTDLSADPILAQIKALGQKSAQDAASGELAGAENALRNYGSVNVPQSLRDFLTSQTPANDPLLGDLPSNPVLGALNDANTATAAEQNPFSTVRQLSGAHDANVHGIDQASNLANLYYSSTHANELGDENQNYLGAQDSAVQQLAALLSGQNNGLIDAVNQAHQNYLSELPNAYARALANGSGDGTTPPTPPPGGAGNSVIPARPPGLPGNGAGHVTSGGYVAPIGGTLGSLIGTPNHGLTSNLAGLLAFLNRAR